MKRVARWAARGAAGLTLLLVVAVGGVYALSTSRLGREYEAPAHPGPEVAAAALADPDVAEGERLAAVLGCTGCHEADLGGSVFAEDAAVGRLVAPNLTEAREQMTDQELATLIRHGVRPDGSGVMVAMPSASFAGLADDDMADLLAYLRSVPSEDRALPPTRLGAAIRIYSLIEELSVPALVDHAAPHPESAYRSSPAAFGGYLARSICSECHGSDLLGEENDFLVTPSLAVAAAYSEEEFRRLLREGISRTDDELDLMREVALGRFAHYTDEEISSILAFARSLAVGGA